MDNRTHVGLDVHSQSTSVAILRPEAVTPEYFTIDSTREAYTKLVKRLKGKDPVFCYEAGPCGYEPFRIFAGLGMACEVIAPSLIPRRPGRRVKTDRIDAGDLARLHRAGELTTIRVPTMAEEGIRDLIRTRLHLLDDRRRCIQRQRSMLLRYGHRFPGKAKGWSTTHQTWASSIRLVDPLAQQALEHLRAAFQTRQTQLAAIDVQVAEAALLPQVAEPVAHLRALRGIDTLSAMTIVTEVIDFRQFASAPAFMCFTGLIPSEHSSGAHQVRGSITHAGNAHVRRVLIESAWNYQHRPAISRELQKRQEHVPAEVIAHAWAAQHRLYRTYWKIAKVRPSQVAAVAVARELAGYIWGIGTGNYKRTVN